MNDQRDYRVRKRPAAGLPDFNADMRKPIMTYTY